MANKLLILGGGESGVGAARLAVQQGWQVLLSDQQALLPKYRQILQQLAVQLEEGSHELALHYNPQLVVKSPGIPPTAAVIVALKLQQVSIISEIEFASRYTTKPIIAITGSNGKTTTSSLIYSMLTYAGINAALAGNIGTSFAGLVALGNYDWYVVEVSSFQLEDIESFRPHIAVLLNITPNHLDRYGYDIARYVDAKFNISRNQTATDYFIYNLDSPLLLEGLNRHPLQAKSLGFSLTPQPEAVAWVHQQTLIVDMTKEQSPPQKRPVLQVPVDQQKLKGKHNQYNSMASAIVGRVLEIRNENVRESLLNFDALEHRLEKVRVVAGVEYINDSKATSVNATWYALESMDRPTIWIVGGVDKGNDYGMLLPMVQEKVKEIIMLGTDVNKIQAAFKGKTGSIHHAHSMEEAVAFAYRDAKPGETVLLSPACASFDLFANYEARGKAFKEQVNRLV